MGTEPPGGSGDAGGARGPTAPGVPPSGLVAVVKEDCPTCHLVVPVLQELDEGVASPAEIDMGAGLALRFGKAPCTTMDAMGRDEVARLIAYYMEKYGVDAPASLDRVGTLVG